LKGDGKEYVKTFAAGKKKENGGGVTPTGFSFFKYITLERMYYLFIILAIIIIFARRHSMRRAIGISK
ncbi:MAG: hypothetical protein V1718_01705, partial [archaeon]